MSVVDIVEKLFLFVYAMCICHEDVINVSVTDGLSGNDDKK